MTFHIRDLAMISKRCFITMSKPLDLCHSYFHWFFSGQVDLYLTEFYVHVDGSPVDMIQSNVQYSYRFDTGLVKTSDGTIPEASNTDINDLSLDLQLYLSRDMMVSDDDYRIQVDKSIEQQTHLRKGKGSFTPSESDIANKWVALFAM